eukprot:scaffold123238_cov69-Phaeocystis_antarctica.AAC.1
MAAAARVAAGMAAAVKVARAVMRAAAATEVSTEAAATAATAVAPAAVTVVVVTGEARAAARHTSRHRRRTPRHSCSCSCRACHGTWPTRGSAIPLPPRVASAAPIAVVVRARAFGVAVVQVQRALIIIGTVESIAAVALGRTRTGVAARGVAARGESVAHMRAERALVDVLTRDAVPCVAVEARAVERACKVGARRVQVAVVVRATLVDLHARVTARGVTVLTRARAADEVRPRCGAAYALGRGRAGACHAAIIARKACVVAGVETDRATSRARGAVQVRRVCRARGTGGRRVAAIGALLAACATVVGAVGELERRARGDARGGCLERCDRAKTGGAVGRRAAIA